MFGNQDIWTILKKCGINIWYDKNTERIEDRTADIIAVCMVIK